MNPYSVKLILSKTLQWLEGKHSSFPYCLKDVLHFYTFDPFHRKRRLGSMYQCIEWFGFLQICICLLDVLFQVRFYVNCRIN